MQLLVLLGKLLKTGFNFPISFEHHYVFGKSSKSCEVKAALYEVGLLCFPELMKHKFTLFFVEQQYLFVVYA